MPAFTDHGTARAEDIQSTAGQEIQREQAMQKWARSCALCHISGVGGAPRVGVAEEWSTRLAQGKQLLMKHTIEGLNNMPPLGYCMSCEAEDFSVLIDFMSGESP